MRVVILARKPFDGSIAQGVTENGTGPFGLGRVPPIRHPSMSIARWPSNVLLQHTECKKAGTRKVRPSNGSGRAGAGSSGFRTEYVGGESKTDGFTGAHVDDTGLETIDAWECSTDCPVPDVDDQSGVGRSPATYVRQAPGFNQSAYGEGVGQPKGTESVNYGDVGGASRFFKQLTPS